MAKGKDFYGKEVTAVIEEACREFGVSQEELNIEVLETGSAGIFGLCKKKAHIRVQKKKGSLEASGQESAPLAGNGEKKQTGHSEETTAPEHSKQKEAVEKTEQQERTAANSSTTKKSEIKKAKAKKSNTESPKTKKDKQAQPQAGKERARGQNKKPDLEPVAPPSEEILAVVQEEICQLLELMGYPATVSLKVEETTLNCHLSGENEEALVGSDGRTLDSLQYLIRKMMSRRLPDRMMLALDAGDFRQRRAEELKERARQLAEEVKTTGKTQAIAALNPAERRVVHMILQEDKAIRSRSVGDGLFKKVLIYKPGKGNKSSARKPRGQQGGRSSEN